MNNDETASASPPKGSTKEAQDWQAMNLLPVPAVWMDIAGNATGGNRAWTDFMGALVPGQDVMGLFHPEDRVAWMARLMACVHAPDATAPAASEAPQERPLRLLRGGREVVWCTVALQRNDALVCMAMHDVTAYQRRWAQMEAASRGAVSLLNGIPAMLYRGRNDRDWSMEMVSDGCRLLTGYAPRDIELGGRLHFSQLILPEHVDLVWDGVQEALLRHRPYRLWYAITCANGSIRPVFEIGQGIYSSNNEVLGVEGMIVEWLAPPQGWAGSIG